MKKNSSIPRYEKDLYCPKCKIFPDRIIEKYKSPLEEIREWFPEGGYYEIVDSNLVGGEPDQLCSTCRTPLVFGTPTDDSGQ